MGHLKQLGAGDARAQRAAPAAAAGAPEAEPAAEVEAEVTEESFAPRLRRFVEEKVVEKTLSGKMMEVDGMASFRIQNRWFSTSMIFSGM